MQNVRTITSKLINHSARHKKLQAQFDAFYEKVKDVLTDKDFPVPDIQVECKEANIFTVSLAGVTMVMVFSTFANDDVLMGKVTGYRAIYFPERKHLQFVDFTFKPDGEANLTDDDGDPVDIAYGGAQLALRLLHQAINDSSDAGQQA